MTAVIPSDAVLHSRVHRPGRSPAAQPAQTPPEARRRDQCRDEDHHHHGGEHGLGQHGLAVESERRADPREDQAHLPTRDHPVSGAPRSPTTSWAGTWRLLADRVALSTTSVAVVYAVMLELGFNVTEYGKVILASCFINDLGTVPSGPSRKRRDPDARRQRVLHAAPSAWAVGIRRDRGGARDRGA